MNRKAYKLCRIISVLLSSFIICMYSKYVGIGILVTLEMLQSILDCPHQPSEMLTSFYHCIFSMQRSVRYILLRQVDKQERNGDNDNKLYVHVYQNE